MDEQPKIRVGEVGQQGAHYFGTGVTVDVENR